MNNVDTILVFGPICVIRGLFFKILLYSINKLRKVWYITQKQFNQIPEGYELPYEKELLKLIIFIYITTPQLFMKHMSSIHTWQQLPQLILVENYDQYLELKQQQQIDMKKAAFLTSSLLDMVQMCSHRNSKPLTLLIVHINNPSDYQQYQILIDLYLNEHIFDVNEENFQETWNKIVQILYKFVQ